MMQTTFFFFFFESEGLWKWPRGGNSQEEAQDQKEKQYFLKEYWLNPISGVKQWLCTIFLFFEAHSSCAATACVRVTAV